MYFLLKIQWRIFQPSNRHPLSFHNGFHLPQEMRSRGLQMDGPSYAVLFNTLALRSHPSLPWLCDEMRQDFLLRGGIPPGDFEGGKIAARKKKLSTKGNFWRMPTKSIYKQYISALYIIHACEQTPPPRCCYPKGSMYGICAYIWLIFDGKCR